MYRLFQEQATSEIPDVFLLKVFVDCTVRWSWLRECKREHRRERAARLPLVTGEFRGGTGDGISLQTISGKVLRFQGLKGQQGAKQMGSVVCTSIVLLFNYLQSGVTNI